MKNYALALLILCSKSAFSQVDFSVPWAMFHACEKHCGMYPSKNYTSFGSTKWKFSTKGKIFSSPAVFEGVAYIGSEDKNLYAVDIATGKELWKFTTEGAIHSSPAVYKDVVYFGSFDGFYYALNKNTGKLRWKFQTGGEKLNGHKGLWGMKPDNEFLNDPFDFYLSSPVINMDDTNLKVYFGSSDGNLYSLDAETGKLSWKFKTNGIIHTSPTLYEGKVFIGSWDTYMYAVDAEAGKEIWKFKTGDHPEVHLLEGIQASATVDVDEDAIYFGARDAYFYALDINTGNLKWKFFNDNSWVLSTAGVKDGSIYFGTSDQYNLISLDAKTGKQNWKFKANGYVYSSPALAGNTVFFGDFTGKMFALDLKSGMQTDVFTTQGRNKNADTVLNLDHIDFPHITKGLDPSLYATTTVAMNKLYSLGSILSSPVVNNGVLYFGSADGSLYALNLKN